MLSTPLLTLATLGAVLSTTALAAPSPNPDASDLTRRDIQPIPEGKTWSVSYECDSTNVDASGTTADMDSGCKKIDGGAPEIQMNYDTKSYYQISMHMYVNDVGVGIGNGPRAN
ncbi:uncharacterized protein K452DRAFT_302530 [Aplosporella prunicola CBS 121167]|uniref:Uncharacterized protein n=1 Tax=Aplosporella prunicola CBS 121167 TaxID=1176127 RepID=A0A6A6AXS7_9PEZI|nr:uncharacterized protein K452DRAFT_302530 [Aplosporella prunicola CBS 121167]KAF2136752.1 hypothetical protein K452DRAFT_302530 [Aplosporella prunicola CBS 121167]